MRGSHCGTAIQPCRMEPSGGAGVRRKEAEEASYAEYLKKEPSEVVKRLQAVRAQRKQAETPSP